MTKKALFVFMLVFILSATLTVYAEPPLAIYFEKVGKINTDVPFTSADFTENYEGESSLKSIRFSTLPEEGELLLNDQPIEAAQVIEESELGGIVYRPESNFTGDVNLTWQASDGNEFSPDGTIKITIEDDTPIPEDSEENPDDEIDEEEPLPEEEKIFPYIDIEDHWSKPYAVDLALDNVFRGNQIGGNFYFEPDTVLTRGDFVMLLNAVLGISGETPNVEDFAFTDKDSMPLWLYNQGLLAYESGIIKGSGTGDKVAFLPYETLNRAAAFTMLYNIIDEFNTPKPYALTFADNSSVPSWSVDAIQNLLGFKVISGYPDNTIRPYGVITRAEAAALISKIDPYVPLPETLKRYITAKNGTIK
ncbi:MAG: S-layer homology domain-containing protein [Eubacteriales bacterium]|nr:S-layer homology domain-containing protein [Eubacteriales bacterium]